MRTIFLFMTHSSFSSNLNYSNGLSNPSMSQLVHSYVKYNRHMESSMHSSNSFLAINDNFSNLSIAICIDGKRFFFSIFFNALFSIQVIKTLRYYQCDLLTIFEMERRKKISPKLRFAITLRNKSHKKLFLVMSFNQKRKINLNFNCICI